MLTHSPTHFRYVGQEVGSQHSSDSPRWFLTITLILFGNSLAHLELRVSGTLPNILMTSPLVLSTWIHYSQCFRSCHHLLGYFGIHGPCSTLRAQALSTSSSAKSCSEIPVSLKPTSVQMPHGYSQNLISTQSNSTSVLLISHILLICYFQLYNLVIPTLLFYWHHQGHTYIDLFFFSIIHLLSLLPSLALWSFKPSLIVSSNNLPCCSPINFT